MSANIHTTLAEDPLQLEHRLEKGIGCVAGMLQIFDRQSALTGRRFGHKRLSGAPDVPTSSCGSLPLDGSESAKFAAVTNDKRYNDSQKQVQAYEGRVAFSGSARPSDSRTVLREPLRSLSDLKAEPSTTPVMTKGRPKLSFYFEDWPSSAPELAQNTPASPTAGFTTKDRAKCSPSGKEESQGSYSSFDGVGMSLNSDQARASLQEQDARPSFSSQDTGRLSVDCRLPSSSSVDPREFPRIEMPTKIKEPPRDLKDGQDASKSPTDLRDGGWPSVNCRDFPRSSLDAAGHSLDHRDLLLANLQLRETPSGYFQSRDFGSTSVDSRSSSICSLGSLSSLDRDFFTIAACDVQKSPTGTERSSVEGNQVDVQATSHSKRRVSNVVARLMGLEELPDSTTQSRLEPAPAVSPRKPCTEAKLLQKLLQYEPLDRPRMKVVSEQQQSSSEDSMEVSTSSASKNSASRKVADAKPRSAQRMLKEGAAVRQSFCRQGYFRSENYQPTERDSQVGNSLVKRQPSAFRNFAESLPLAPKQQEAKAMSQKKYAQLRNQFPEAILTVLQHSEEVTKQQQSSNTMLGELEGRLQQPRVSNSQQERKTLSQILEGMELKGLLHPPRLERENHFGTQHFEDEILIRRNSYDGYSYKRDPHCGCDQSHPMKSIPHMQAIQDKRACQEEKGSQDNRMDVSTVEEKSMPQQGRQASVVIMKSVSRQGQGNQQKSLETMPVAGASASQARKVSKAASRTPEDQQGLATPREPISKFNAEETMSLGKRRAGMTQGKKTLSVSARYKSRPASRSAKAPVSASPPKSQKLPVNAPASGSSVSSSLNSIDVEKGRKQRMSRDVFSPVAPGIKNKDAEPKKVLRRRSSDVALRSAVPAIVPTSELASRISGRSSGKGRPSESLSGTKACRTGGYVSKDGTSSSEDQVSNCQEWSPESGGTKFDSELHTLAKSKLSRRSAPHHIAQSGITGITSSVMRPNLEVGKDHSFDICSPEQLSSRLQYPEAFLDEFEPGPSQVTGRLSRGRLPTVFLNQDEVKCLGEVLAEGAEQPSPVSVLDTSFYDEDHSPRAVNSNTLSVKGGHLNSRLEALAKESAWEEHLVEGDMATLHSSTMVTAEVSTRSVEAESTESKDMFLLSSPGSAAKPVIGCKAEEMAYVRDLLISSGLTDESKMILAWHSPSLPMDPELFDRSKERTRSWIGEEKTCRLEVDETSKIQSQRKGEQEVMNRRLLFDCVNDITARQLRPYVFTQSWISQSQMPLRKPPTGLLLVERVWTELQELSCSASEDACDKLYSILQKDMRRSDRWLDCSTEIGEVGLELELMIFKGLLEEAVTELSVSSSLNTQRPAVCAQ